MSYDATLKTLFQADGTLTGLLVGGIYTWEDTGRLGFSRQSIPNAYDANGLLRPCLIIKTRDDIAQYEIPDADFQFVDTKAVAELWFYDDGNNTYTTIKAAQDRCYLLLQDRRINGAFYVQIIGHLLDKRDTGNDRAIYVRSDYTLFSHFG